MGLFGACEWALLDGKTSMKGIDPELSGPYPRLAVTVDQTLLPRFLLLLQEGAQLPCRVGCSVDVFLHEELGATQETIERIQSVMLDGKPVDDIKTAIVHDGSTLALSSAMPGLVGAALRRGGAYSSFRGAITYHESGTACERGEGRVGLKIFNLLMAEMGPGLLRRGVLVRTADLIRFLAGHRPELRSRCRFTLDGKAVRPAALPNALRRIPADRVMLSLSSGSGS